MYKSSEQMFNDTLKTMNDTSIWVKTGALAGGAILSFLAPIQYFIIATLVFIFADVVTGIWAAKHRNQEFNADRLSKTVSKLILYPSSILLSYVMVVVFFKGIPVAEGLTYMVALFLSMIEFQSNIENIGDIVGIDIWTNIKGWFADKIKIKSDDQPPTPPVTPIA